MTKSFFGEEFLEMPTPTPEDLESELFNALWETMKKWDINVPEYYRGYCGCNGSHIKILLDVLKPVIRNDKINSILNG